MLGDFAHVVFACSPPHPGPRDWRVSILTRWMLFSAISAFPIATGSTCFGG